MTAVARRAWGRRLAAALLVLFCGAVLGGCGAIDGMLDTEEALSREGIQDPSVSFESSNGVESVYVTWTPSVDSTSGAVAEGLLVSGIVWRVAPLKMDVVETDPDVTPNADAGSARRVYSRAELEGRFGPRPPGLDKEFTELMNLRAIGIGVLLAVLFFIGIVVLVVVLVVRSSRKKRAQHAGWPAPAQTGWQPYPQPPQPWQQQPGWPPQGGPAYPPQPPYAPPPQGAWPPQPPPPAPGNDPWNPPAG